MSAASPLAAGSIDATQAQGDNVLLFAKPATPTAGRSFTQSDNLVYEIMGRLGGSTTLVLLTLQRFTVGYHRAEVRMSLAQLHEWTQLSRPTIIEALQVLLHANILRSDAEQLAQTQIRTYQWLDPSEWRVDDLRRDAPAPTGKKSLQVVHAPRARQKSLPVDSAACQDFLPVAAPTCQKTLPYENKGESKDTEQRKDAALCAAIPVPDSFTQPKLPSLRQASQARSRKYSGEEQAYVRALIEQVQTLLHVPILPFEGREREAAHWFFHAGPDGAPAPIEQVLAVYQIAKLDPFHQGQYLSLQQMENHYTAYLSDPAAFEQEMRRRAARGRIQRQGSRPTGATPDASPVGSDAHIQEFAARQRASGRGRYHVRTDEESL